MKLRASPAPPPQPGAGAPATAAALDVASLDRAALATAQLVMSTHANSARWLNTADIVATYDWMLRDTGLAPGLHVYDTPRAATTYLHGLRLCDNRSEICQDPACPGGDLGPAEARAAVAAARIVAPDPFALSTTRYVMGYHPSPDEAVETLALYRWVVEARLLEAHLTPRPTCGADRNAHRVDHAVAASTLLHELRAARDRDLPCAHCADPTDSVIELVVNDPWPLLEQITDLSDIAEFDV